MSADESKIIVDQRVSHSMALAGENPAVKGDSAVIALLYIAALAAAEITAIGISSLVSVICHAVLLLIFLNHALFTQNAAYRRVLPVLSLVPLLRVLSFTMPLRELPQLYWYAMIGTPLLIAAVLTGRLIDKPWSQLGLKLQFSYLQVVIAATGVPLGIVGYILIGPQPLITSFTWRELATGIVIITIFTAFTEELMFRGLLQHVLTDLFPRTRVLLSCALFTILAIGSMSLKTLVFTAIIGLFFGWCVDRTRSIWGVVIAHSLINIGMFLLLPFLW